MKRTALLLLASCSAGPLTPGFDAGLPPVDSGVPDAGACMTGETRCEGDLISTCGDDGQFGAAAVCDAGVCVASACRPPTDAQLAEASELVSMVEYIKAQTAYSKPLDWSGIEDGGVMRIFRGDGSELSYFDALYHAFIAVPEGHQALDLSADCGKLVPYPMYSERGVCGRPHARGVIVTFALANNAFGLAPGDVVTGLGTAQGQAVLDALADRPICAESAPTQAFLHTQAASNFVDVLRQGDVLTIESPDGGARMLTVGDLVPLDGGPSGANCEDPFHRVRTVAVTSELIADGGIGLIRLPGFTDPEQTFPTNPTQAQLAQYLMTFEAKIQAAFDAVKTAPAIIWDVRGNLGGLTQVGLDIASGFPSAGGTDISYCNERIANSSPPMWNPAKYAQYKLVPGGPFAYSGKVALLTEGLNYSAADYFTRAAKTRTSALLVGAPTAGAFGATYGSKMFSGPPPFEVFIDPNLCFDAQTNAPLEGNNTQPAVAVDYDPADLAAGRDTVLERAIEELQH